MPATGGRGSDHRSAGSLRGRALDAAMRLVEAEGAERISLRILADALNTGPASLYYHFESKDDLLAEVSAEGFRRLERGFLAARKRRRPRPLVYAYGSIYLGFLRRYPALYRLMFDERFLGTHPKARAAEQETFNTFAAALSQQSDDGVGLAFALWALGRGTAALCIAAGEPNQQEARRVARHVATGLEAVLGHSVRRIARPRRCDRANLSD
ncbi:MAG TPA: TetR/AcrR family transcriptional regulator [Phenylobacterium sp.]|jgi:AcrR family transcriptional regulator|uniref:TetR/AcrR family transcriptional regulator n=1 Tax=Phenylobacterium sp. TaxID=1871053 RepID=UPI002BFDA0E3|nr:TetR/AcrR family transcriptional regulator [Phenylobacterium sp.]HXA37568.1 TetR/AcrR family transcriptional regulator [Phenylobacterium sp.]